ncbi:hypothetical protein [Haloferula sp. A504]|uniref:hypothetical protein n=1 Tax=Haloferula sp. A504 TaxID=3373601 RepID=UPI0031CA39D2|nr:hypothetical protein [Verrucomicrobiaceae bacterium E54]
MSSAPARCLAAVLLLGACFPQVFAGVLVMGSLQGDHELQCHFDNHRVELTLHHPRLSAVLGTAQRTHRHTMVEKLLVGRGVSHDEPDHRWSFGWQEILVDDDESRDQEVGWVACHEPGCIEVVRLEVAGCDRVAVACPDAAGGGLSPPRAMRRGEVMRR